MPPPFNETIASPRKGRQLDTFGELIDLTADDRAGGRAAVSIMMLEAGQLHMNDADGNDSSITVTLAAGTVVVFQAGAIRATQTAKIFVSWSG